MAARASAWTIKRVGRAAVRRARRLLPSRPRPAILMYHRIADASFDPWGLAVTPDNFGRQLESLARHRSILSLTEFARRHAEGTLPDTAATLTFDDGYECAASVAAPLLEAAGLPATIFIPATLIERGRPFWWDELQFLVLHHEQSRLMLDGIAVDLGNRAPEDKDWRPGARPGTARQRAFLQIWASLRERRPQDVDLAMQGLRDQAGDPADDEMPRPMTPEQVRSTAGSLIHFGSHGLTHPWLSSLDEAEKMREIRDSIGACERLSGQRPTAFAYPSGNFDPESQRIAHEAGYSCACATGDRPVSPSSPAYALPRLAVGDWSAEQMARRLGH